MDSSSGDRKPAPRHWPRINPYPQPQKWELHGLKHTFPEKLKSEPTLFSFPPKFLQHRSGEPLGFRDWVTW